MKTITDAELALVTGGKLSPSTTLGTTGGSSSDDQLLSTLQGIQSSLKDLGKNNNSLFGGNNALLFMTMALAMNRRSEVVVYGSGYRRGFSWRVW